MSPAAHALRQHGVRQWQGQPVAETKSSSGAPARYHYCYCDCYQFATPTSLASIAVAAARPRADTAAANDVLGGLILKRRSFPDTDEGVEHAQAGARGWGAETKTDR